MPALSQLQREYAKKGIQFVGLGVDSNKNVQAFLQKVKVAYPVYVTGFGGVDLSRAFGNNAGGLAVCWSLHRRQSAMRCARQN